LNDATFVEAPGLTRSLLSVVLATTVDVAPSVTVTLADFNLDELVSFPANLPSTETSNLNVLFFIKSASGIILISNLTVFHGSTVVDRESIPTFVSASETPLPIAYVLEVLPSSVNAA
jgi:hypothetical protein